MTQKDNVDTKRHAVEGQVEVRNYVLLRNTKTNKLSPNYDRSPCEVIDRNKEEVKLRKKNGVEIKRYVSLLKYQENGTSESESESESVAPLQPIASPISVQQTAKPSSAML